MGTKALTAKLSSAANKLQPALRVLGQLRASLEKDLIQRGISTNPPAWLAGFDALEAELFRLEAAVGVVTQPTLFEESIFVPDEPVPASATITFLVDCDFCGAECEAAGNRHTCEHCGQEFTIED